MIKNVEKGMTVFAFQTMHDPVEEGIVVDSTIRETTFGGATSNPKTYKSIKLVHWKYSNIR